MRANIPAGRAGPPGPALGDAQGHEGAAAAALDQQGDRVARARLFQLRLERLRTVGRPAVHREDEIAREHAGAARRALGTLHGKACLHAAAAPLRLGERHQAQAETVGTPGADARRTRFFLRRHADPDSLRGALADELHRGHRTGRRLGGRGDEIGLRAHRAGAEAGDDVAGAQAGLRRRPLRFHRGDEGPFGGREAEGPGELRCHFLDLHADAPARHCALHAQPRHDLHRHVDGDRERKPDRAAACAEDERVHPHHLARQVEEGPARMAGVHRHVGLDEAQVRLRGYGSLRGADDAGGDAALETEGRADGHHPFARLQP